MSREAAHQRARYYQCHVGKKFRHFKGGVYVVDSIAVHSETGQLLVVYHPVDDPVRTCARPLDMFFSPVDRAKYPDAGQYDRFEKIG